jgi:hypothetical protein
LYLVPLQRFLEWLPWQHFLKLPPWQCFWNSCHSNEILAVTMLQLEIEEDHVDSRRLGLYHIMILLIGWDVYHFVVCTDWLRISQLLGWPLIVNIKLKGALPSVATIYNM